MTEWSCNMRLRLERAMEEIRKKPASFSPVR
jgi:hypothetical protein